MTRIVYRLNNAPGFQYFLPENLEEGDLMRMGMRCKPRAKEWQPIPVYNRMPFFEAGDLYNYDRDYLILSPKAWNVLAGRGFLEPEIAEVLPLEYDGETYGLVNVLMCINCLDHDETIWLQSGRMKLVEHPAFNPSRLPFPGLFKIPETCASSIYVLVDDTEQFDFKFVVESAGLKGFQFTRLWDDENGVVNSSEDESTG